MLPENDPNHAVSACPCIQLVKQSTIVNVLMQRHSYLIFGTRIRLALSKKSVCPQIEIAAGTETSLIARLDSLQASEFPEDDLVHGAQLT